jgi:uncharacterized protein YciI
VTGDEQAIWARNAEVPLFVALGRNRPAFRWDEPEHRPLILRHVTWCQDQEAAGRLIGAGPLAPAPGGADALMIVAAPTRESLDRLLAADPLVVAGVRRYEVTGWLLNQGTARHCARAAA